MSWHIYPRTDPRYYTADLITDILSGGGSSRLYQSLVKEKQLFSNIDCYHFGSTDAGIITIEGKLVKGVDIKLAEAAVNEELKKLQQDGISVAELEKVKNKTESAMAFEDMAVMSRAASIAMYELLGDANMINTELANYQAVTADEILKECRIIFDANNSSTMYYLSNN
jgi:predicted Zn-dependent peptidase